MCCHYFQPEIIASFLVRELLGILFLFQAIDKIFAVGIKSEIEAIEPAYQKIKLPHFLIQLVAYFTSYAELIGGTLLILGVFKYAALYLLGIDLLVVAFGMSLINPVWKMDLFLPRFALLIFLLIYPANHDLITLQHFIQHFR